MPPAAEFHELFDLSHGLPVRLNPAADLLVLSNLRGGSAATSGTPGLSLRYVHRGVEDYRFDRQRFAVREGQLLVASGRSGERGAHHRRRGCGDDRPMPLLS